MTVVRPGVPLLVLPRPGDRAAALVARHPVTTSLVAMFGVGWTLMIPAALTGLPIEPFLLATVLLGQLGGSVLVAAATGGRAAVRELFARVLRWRVHPGLWLLAVLGIPAAALALTTVAFGPGALRSVLTDPAIGLGWLASLAILPLVNLWEETAWAGTVQERLTERHGPVRGAALTGLGFALLHLPLQLGGTVRSFLTGMAALFVVAFPFRLVAGWLYARSGRSILLVATFHAAFNATNNGSLLRAAAGQGDRTLIATVPWIVVGVAAAGILLVGRRGAARDRRRRLRG